MVLVEYCCHGNLQQFLLSRRHSFLSQVNPITGVYDPSYFRSVSESMDNGSRKTSANGNGDYSGYR